MNFLNTNDNNEIKDDKKGGVDRSSTVIAKDPEGKHPHKSTFYTLKN